MKNSAAFLGWTCVVLLAAGLITYFYGIPMLSEGANTCHYARTRSFGCSSPFGTFMTFLCAAVALAIGGLWSRFGR
jgi:hypothetical protein